MPESYVKVVFTGHGRGEVFVDGIKLKHVKGVNLRANVDHANVVDIELIPASVEIEGIFETNYIHDTTTIESDSRQFARAEPPAA